MSRTNSEASTEEFLDWKSSAFADSPANWADEEAQEHTDAEVAVASSIKPFEVTSYFDFFQIPDNTTHLIINGVEDIDALPDSVCQELRRLQSLRIWNCDSLQTLPEDIGSLALLEELEVRNCWSFASLPDSIGALARLAKLVVASCSLLAALPESLGLLSGLQWLELSNCHALEDLPDLLGRLGGLQVLHLRGCCSLAALPKSFHELQQLRQLDLSGCSALQLQWSDLSGSLGQLETLGMPNSSSLQQLLEALPAARLSSRLTTLCLRECTLVRELPESLGRLTGLQLMDLAGCSSVKKLPEQLGQLTGLQQLNMAGCSSLAALPESLGRLAGLQHLDLADCSSLAVLPQSLGQLTGLLQLYMAGCSSLATLPDSLGQLAGLQQLDLAGCSSLATLPQSLGQLFMLQVLDLAGCSSLAALPESLGRLSELPPAGSSTESPSLASPKQTQQQHFHSTYSQDSSVSQPPQAVGLQRLDLSKCSKLKALPKSARQLQLRQLDLSGCSALQLEWSHISGSLGQLVFLGLPNSSSLAKLLEALPAARLSRLEQLRVVHCHSLAALPASLGQLSGLAELDLSSCSLLAALPESLGRLSGLQVLDVAGCSSLPVAAIPEPLRSLSQQDTRAVRTFEVTSGNSFADIPAGTTDLIINGVDIITMPPAVCGLKQLRRLRIFGCQRLRSLSHSMRSLELLEELEVRDSPDFIALPGSIGALARLAKLVMVNCSSLTALSLGRLSGLQWLELSNCHTLEDLPESLGRLGGLQVLHLRGCCSLAALPKSFHELQQLRQLDLSGCSALQLQWSDLSGSLGQLETLGMPNSSSLQQLLEALPAARLSRLKQLHLVECTSMKALPENLGQLSGLQQLDLAGCSSLAELPDSCRDLRQLEKLDISSCSKLQSLAKHSVATPVSGLPECSALVKEILRRQTQHKAVVKLATQQETMLTTLERMSWLVLLLATATFLAFQQPPGGFSDSHQVLVGSPAACRAPPMATKSSLHLELPRAYADCSLFLFFVFDMLSFSLSLGCVMMIVVLSMPRMPYRSEAAEAGRFWWLLLCTWGLLYLAVAFGFAAFVASAVSMFPLEAGSPPALVAPLLPGFVLLLLGAALMGKRLFRDIFPGWRVLRKGLPFAGRDLKPVARDVEMGELVMSERFWQRAAQALQAAVGGPLADGYRPLQVT